MGFTNFLIVATYGYVKNLSFLPLEQR